MWWSIFISSLLVASCNVVKVNSSTSAPEQPDETTIEPATTLLPEKSQVKPTIRFLHITSNIKYRYATTLVSTRVVNPANQSGEATFTVTLPESAFISEFLMEVKDKVYKAYVKEKEEAKTIYEQAVHAGQFAGHIAQDARDSNQFTVSVNIEAHGKVNFNLTYEQLLARNLGVYSNTININPQQIVEDMSVVVNIEEPTAIVNLEVPELQLTNEAAPEKPNEYAKIEEISPNHKRVVWAPTPEEQKSKNSEGLSGQFNVKYDVNRGENPQQILVDEGYFVHFFAPESLPKLRKHVVFVLDFSGSMSGQKLEQLKDAMKQIFSDLGPKDYFSIVIFQSWIEVWSPSTVLVTRLPSYLGGYDRERLGDRKVEINGTLDSKYVVEATPGNIELAQHFMGNYSDLGSTNIIGGLRTGLQLVNIGEEHWTNESDPPQAVMVFLTDGQPNEEEYRTDVIITTTKALNIKQCPIFSLAFGYGADLNFLRKLSLQNSGFARNIYEAADATQQLKNFYATIASPLLSNVTFTYLPGQVDNSYSTNQEFPVFFSGSELVVAGKVNKENIPDKKIIGELRGITASGPQTYPIIIDHVIPVMKPQNTSTGHLEKAWSYLTIQQLLDKADSLDNGEEKNQTKKKALDLALQYAFVTPLTSLVVVKPNETEAAVDATKVRPGLDGPFQGSAYPTGAGGGFSGAAGYPAGASFAMAMPAPGFIPTTPFYNKPLPANEPYPQSAISGSIVEEEAAEMETAHMDREEPPRKVPLQDVVWLQEALIATDANKTVTLEGTNYKLGMNETNTTFGDCQVNTTSGKCHHLQYCALNVFQADVSQFLPYKCHIPGDYLGVCCPEGIF